MAVEPRSLTLFGEPREGVHKDACQTIQWIQAVQNLESVPLDKLYVYNPTWSTSEGFGKWPADTLRLVAMRGDDGKVRRKVKFNEGLYHGEWYLAKDLSLVISCTWAATKEGENVCKTHSFHPIPGTANFSGIKDERDLKWNVLLMPFVDGTYQACVLKNIELTPLAAPHVEEGNDDASFAANADQVCRTPDSAPQFDDDAWTHEEPRTGRLSTLSSGDGL